MELITEELEEKLPGIGETIGEDAKALVKLFAPWCDWTWYVIEYDPETGHAFGYVEGHVDEAGSFSIKEIKELTGPGGLKIERDRHWTPKTIREIQKSKK